MENVQIGSYHILKRLGKGAFAEVYLGEHIHLGTFAAVKILTTKLTDEEIALFRNEARTIIELEHPNIVRVYDFGIHGRIPFIVMSYAPNGSMRGLHPRGTRLSPQTVVTYIKQIASALQYAHDRKIIHRDVKPDNLLIGRNNEVLVSDFGIATAAHSTHSLRTQDGGQGPGTPNYNAPEQIQGKPRPASDQYALGIIVYEWLTGTWPFVGFNHFEIAYKHVYERPPSLREKVPTISVEVEQVVLKALAKEPEERYPTILEFAQALEGASRISQTGTVLETTLTRLCLACGQKLQVQETFCSVCGALNDDVRLQHTTMEAANIRPLNVTGAKALSTQQLPVNSESKSTPERMTLITPDGYDRAISVAWSPDGRYIATGLIGRHQNLNAILIWEACTGEKVLIFPMEEPAGIDWSPDGRYITAQSQFSRRILDTQAGRILHEFSEADCQGGIVWSPDGKHIAVLAQSTLRVLETQTGHILYELAEADRRGGVIWSPDGRYIAYTETRNGENTRLVVRNPQTGHLVHDVNGFTHDNARLQWSLDGRYIASYCSQKKVDIYDTQTGHWERANLPKGKIWYSNWSPDGRYIATTIIGKTIENLIVKLFNVLAIVVLVFLVVIFVLWVIESIIPPITTIPLWNQSGVVSLIIGLIFWFIIAPEQNKPEFILTDVLAKKQIRERTLPEFLSDVLAKKQIRERALSEYVVYGKKFNLSRDGKYVIHKYARGRFRSTVRLTVIGNEDISIFTTSSSTTNPENLNMSISTDGRHIAIAIITGTSTEIQTLNPV